MERRSEDASEDITRESVELARLHDIASKITAGQELSEVLANLAMVAAEEAGTRMSAIFLVREDASSMEMMAHLGIPDALADTWGKSRIGQGVWGLAAMKGRVVIVEDYDKAPMVAAERTAYQEAGIHSAWAVPLLGRDHQTIGSFAMFFSDRKRPRRQEVFMAQLYGFHASMAIENARLFEQLRIQAIKDGKTGLFNHDHFLELFRLEIDRSARQQNELSVLIADIDDYKAYNDTYGHLMGDRALRICGSCLRRIARSTDIPARYGGDELAMVLPDTSTAGALAVAERLRIEVESAKFPGHDGELDVNLTVSVGVSTFPGDGIEIDSLIEFADRGLYVAKGKGKNQVGRAASMQAVSTRRNV